MSKPMAGERFPTLTVNLVNGGTLSVGQPADHWQLLVVYRGRHCPRCKRYLNALDAMQSDWQKAGFQVAAISADNLERASADVDEYDWKFPVGYALSEADMQRLGLYITDPLSADEAPARFAEPAVFCLRPDATIQIAALSNGPSARPDLAELLDGMAFTIQHDRPARGMVHY